MIVVKSTCSDVQEEIKTVYVELWDVMIMGPHCQTELVQCGQKYDLGWIQQLRGKRQICNNLLLYESDLMQGEAMQCRSHWLFKVWWHRYGNQAVYNFKHHNNFSINSSLF